MPVDIFTGVPSEEHETREKLMITEDKARQRADFFESEFFAGTNAPFCSEHLQKLPLPSVRLKLIFPVF